MNEEQMEQIRAMLLDLIDTMDQPEHYPTHEDFKRDWLHAVADIASEEARK